MNKYEDQTRTCSDCGGQFTWTAGEQEFFHEKGFTDPPERCQACRQARRAGRERQRDGR
jgi:Probable zinc-ribbon domain